VKRMCGDCVNPIQSGNKSGYCRKCFDRKFRKNKKRQCSGCKATLDKSNKSGMCVRCLVLSRRVEPKICSGEGCDVELHKYNTSGHCYRHRLPNRRSPVMTERVAVVIRHVCGVFRMDPKLVVEHDRHRRTVEARATVAAILRKQGMTFGRIGERLGRDHSSICNLVGMVPVYAARNPLVARLIREAE